MKFKKFVSVMLALSMAAAFAGCSKVKSITGDDFRDAFEELGAEEVDPEDAEDFDDDDMEDGIYVVMDSDYLEENLENNDVSSSLGMYGISVPDSIIDPEDIEEATCYFRMVENSDDISSLDDIEDLNADMVLAMQITLSDADLAEDFMDGIADSLDDYCGIDVGDLSSAEYYSGKNQGYVKVHFTVEQLVEAFYDSDIYDVLTSYAGASDDLDDVIDALDGMSGDIAVATYVNGENVVVIIAASINQDAEFADEFCSTLGVDNPVDVAANPEIAQGTMDYIDDTLGSLIASFAAMSSYDY